MVGATASARIRMTQKYGEPAWIYGFICSKIDRQRMTLSGAINLMEDMDYYIHNLHLAALKIKILLTRI